MSTQVRSAPEPAGFLLRVAKVFAKHSPPPQRQASDEVVEAVTQALLNPQYPPWSRGHE